MAKITTFPEIVIDDVNQALKLLSDTIPEPIKCVRVLENQDVQKGEYVILLHSDDYTAFEKKVKQVK